MIRTVSLLLLTAGIASLAMAGTVAPEIDPTAGVSGLALVSGALLVLGGSRLRKSRRAPGDREHREQ